jgi:hypothetical protein
VPVLGVAEGQIVRTPEPEVFAKDWSAAWNSVLVINYRNERGRLVNEVLEFDGDRVRRGHGTYLD